MIDKGQRDREIDRQADKQILAEKDKKEKGETSKKLITPCKSWRKYIKAKESSGEKRKA